MRQTRGRRIFRHVVACLCAVPFVLNCIFHSPENKHTITRLDRATQVVANYIGDASFALTGSLAAGMEGMDLLGCVIVGFVTALGGGTWRCIFLGDLPAFWMTSWDEFILVIVVGAMTFLCWPWISKRFQLTSSGEWLFWTDTIGLGVFAASGAAVSAANHENVHVAASALCGMSTATFGGLTRDVLIGRPPRILYSMLEIYGIPAYLGGLAAACVIKYADEDMISEAIMLGTWITIHLRVFAVNHDLKLPSFPGHAVYSKETRPRQMAAELALEEDKERESHTHSYRANAGKQSVQLQDRLSEQLRG